jgi:hypothetical protein
MTYYNTVDAKEPKIYSKSQSFAVHNCSCSKEAMHMGRKNERLRDLDNNVPRAADWSTLSLLEHLLLKPPIVLVLLLYTSRDRG